MVNVTQACSVDGCDKPKLARGWCGMHWKRWRTTGSLELRKPSEKCSAEDCQAPPRSTHAQYCETHYYRLRRTGKLTVDNPQRKQRGICTVDGCETKDHGPHGLCAMHFTRLRRHGDPLALRPNPMPAGPDHSRWTGELASYRAVHQRVKKQRGVPSLHICVDCGGQAQHWSYDHADQNELFEEGFGAYSIDIDHYEPRCVRCHKNFDMKFVMANRKWHPNAF